MTARENLLADLIDRPERFDVGTALRIAEAAGGDVAVHAPPSIRLAARPVTAAAANGNDVVLTSSVAGLVGALGPLPPPYTELASRQLRARSKGLVAFLDVFATRLLRLMVGAGEKYRLAPLFRWRGIAADNGIVTALFGFAGFGTPALRERNVVGDATLLRYAGLFASRTRSAAALRAILADDLGLPVEIEQFRGRWLEVDPAERTRMSPGAGNQLGVSAVAGAAVYDRQGAFRVVIGPLRYPDYVTLTPGSPRLARTVALAKLFVGVGLEFDVKIVLAREDVPETQLEGAGPRLGWNTWVRLAPAATDAHDAVVRPDAA